MNEQGSHVLAALHVDSSFQDDWLRARRVRGWRRVDPPGRLELMLQNLRSWPAPGARLALFEFATNRVNGIPRRRTVGYLRRNLAGIPDDLTPLMEVADLRLHQAYWLAQTYAHLAFPHTIGPPLAQAG